ncbi:MAG: hypothetical protein CMJ48_12760 [Planctomycetaceae bacterium]|nr:hypothetical protein [Planctomycetaceae bacterium]
MKPEDFHLDELLVFQPGLGRLLLGQDRMLLFRQEAFAFLRTLLFEQLGERLSRAMLTQFGYRCGYGDYQALSTSFDWDTEADQVGCGPLLHSWEGLVRAEPLEMEFDRERGHFYFRGVWRNSYEVEIHLDRFGVTDHSVCYSLTGYASGWCTAFFGKPVLAVETHCVGKGDAVCEWLIQPYDKWDERGDAGKEALEATSISIAGDLERTVQQRTEDLRKAFSQLEEKNRELAELDTLKSQFLANVSHELRTPLTLILGPLERILSARDGRSVESVRDELQRMSRNGHRLYNLVDGLLDFSRLEAGHAKVRRQPTDLVRLVDALVDDARSQAELKHVSLECVTGVTLPTVDVDPGMIERILVNLLGNALKFTPPEGRIVVKLTVEGEWILLSVADTGPGIPDHQQELIFERFRQADASSTRKHEGTGIGLSLVKEFSELLGGSVSLESRLGFGSTFTVRLPLHGLTSADGESRPPGLGSASAAGRFAGMIEPIAIEPESGPAEDAREGVMRPRILIADDNADMRDYLREVLSDDYDVETVGNGCEAFESVCRNAPDVVLSDVMMPEMDGMELAARIKQDADLAGIPVVLLTARTGNDEITQGLERGADDYLAKPFSVEELHARVHSAYRMASMHQQLASHADELESLVDERTRELQGEITKRSALQQTQKELIEELKRKNRELESFTYTVSHDLKAPLVTTAGFLGLLREDLANKNEEAAESDMATIDSAMKKMRALLDGLLDLSRAGRVVELTDEVAIGDLVDEVLELLSGAIEQRGVVVQRGSGFPTVVGDRLRLHQVVQNLIDNAVKFSDPSDPRIEIGTRIEDDEVVCFVWNNGTGIEPEFQSTIFGLFHQLALDVGGTGIGLTLAKTVIEKHRGRLWVESDGQDAGATFCFVLPKGR